MRTATRQFLLLGLLAIGLAGCAADRVQVVPLRESHLTPTEPSKVEILHLRPQRAYIELAQLTLNRRAGTYSEEQVYEQFRIEAGKVGADAVMLVNAWSTKLPTESTYVGNDDFCGVAIRFRDAGK